MDHALRKYEVVLVFEELSGQRREADMRRQVAVVGYNKRNAKLVVLLVVYIEVQTNPPLGKIEFPLDVNHKIRNPLLIGLSQGVPQLVLVVVLISGWRVGGDTDALRKQMHGSQKAAFSTGCSQGR